MIHEHAPAARDHARFRALFELHHASLLRILHVRGVDARDVEDLASEVWMAVQRRLPEEAPRFDAIEDPLEFRGRTAAWVAEFARRRAMRWRRDATRRWVILGATAVEDPLDEGEGVEALHGRAARRALARGILDAIPDPAARALLTDVFVEEMTQAEAARARGWDESRFRRALRAALDDAARVARRMKRAG